MRFASAVMNQVSQSSIRNRLLKALSPENFQLLRLEPVSLPAGMVLVEPQIPIEFLYFMETGMTSITTDTSAGQIEVGMIGREGLVFASPVMLGADQTPHLHFVQMPGSALRIAKQDLLTAVEQSSSLRSLLLRSVQALLIQIAQTAYVNAVYTIEVRLARWLLMCHDRVEDDELILTHDLLAKMLGVRRSGVSVATQILERSGFIRAKRRRITILNRAGLETMARGSYGLSEAQYSELIEASSFARNLRLHR